MKIIAQKDGYLSNSVSYHRVDQVHRYQIVPWQLRNILDNYLPVDTSAT